MTKKHFECAAKLIKESKHTKKEKDLLINFVIDLFLNFNGKFDTQRFRKACSND